MKHAHKARLKPNTTQKSAFDFWFRRCNDVFNVGLEEKLECYKKTGKYISFFDQKKELVDVKNWDASWKDVPNKSLTDMLKRLDTAFQKFFKKKSGFPNFKPLDQLHSIFFAKTDVSVEDGKLYLPKLKTPIAILDRREVKQGWTSVQLCRDNGLYSVSFLYDDKKEPEQPVLSDNFHELTGMDLGLMNMWVDSDGNVAQRFDVKLYNRYQKRIAELQRSLSTKTRGSRQYKRVKKQIGKAHSRLLNSRKDFIHKATTKYIDNVLSTPELVIGDIGVADMVNKDNKKSRKGLRVSFYNAALGEAKRQLAYKGQKKGHTVTFVDEKFTSKACSCCGHTKDDLKLSERTYTCNECQTHILRDGNSAVNMKLVRLGQFHPWRWNSLGVKYFVLDKIAPTKYLNVACAA